MSVRNVFRVIGVFIVSILIWLPLSVQAQSPSSKVSSQPPKVAAPNYVPSTFPIYQQRKLVGSDIVEGFGRSLAISADNQTVAIGAPGSSDQGTMTNGAVYIFAHHGDDWTETAKLLANDKANQDQMGGSVALSADGNTLLVGTPYQEDDDFSANSGAAYVFVRSGNVWTQQAKLTSDGKIYGEHFGNSVSLSADGNTALIGSPGRARAGSQDVGGAWVFTRSGNSWSPGPTVYPSDLDAYDIYGAEVSLSSDASLALISAPGQTDSSGKVDKGVVYVFTRSGVAWTQQTKLAISNNSYGHYFGGSIALNDDATIALIGDYAAQEAEGYVGVAYIFIRSGSIWTKQAKLTANDRAPDDEFGANVALDSSGNTALIMASYEDDSGTANNGAAYIFTNMGGVWTQRSKLLAKDKQNYDYFGISGILSPDGRTALVGSLNTDNFVLPATGAVYVYGEVMPPLPPPTSPDTVGVYSNSVWYLRNTNTTGVADIWAVFGGETSDLPVVGDWNGDGIDSLGVYRSNVGQFILSDGNSGLVTENYRFTFGNPGDTPFVGHWTSDMLSDGVGVFRSSNGILYQRKTLTTGVSDFSGIYGDPGDQIVAGDWNSNNLDSVGVYRASNATWYLSYNNIPSGFVNANVEFVWTIDSNTPIVGDWEGDHSTTVGFFATAGVFHLRSTIATTGTDNVFAFGQANGKPVAGKWASSSKPPLGNILHNSRPGIIGNDANMDGNAD